MSAHSFIETLILCETTTGEGSKNAIKNALADLDTTGQTLMHYTLDPFIVFGIRNVDTSGLVYADHDPRDIGFLIDTLDALAAREVTGNVARDLWTHTLKQFTQRSAHYIERILDKDPRGGFSAETFNKVHPTNPIRTFEVMLADTCQTAEEFDEKVSLPAWAPDKFDGQRNIAIVRKIGSKYQIDHHARSGKASEHLDGLFDEDLILMREELGYDYVADGEAFAGNFTETINAKKKENKKAKENMRYRLFFVMPIEQWMSQKCTITMGENLKTLQELMPKIAAKRQGDEKVILENGRMIHTYAEMEAAIDESINVNGNEGLIIKALNGVYEFKRSITWCKAKKFFDADLLILALYPGKKKTRLENSLGGVVAGGYLEDGTLIITCIGSGFSDEERALMWENPEDYVNKATIVTKYQEVTKGKGKTAAALRFGTFEYIRDDKFVEISELDLAEQSDLINKLIATKIKR